MNHQNYSSSCIDVSITPLPIHSWHRPLNSMSASVSDKAALRYSLQYMRYGEYEHRLQICRGEYPGEMSNRTALHESKILILEFDEEHIVSYYHLFSSQIMNSERQVRIKRIGNSSANLRHPFTTSVSAITIRPTSITYFIYCFSHKTRKNVEFTSYDQLMKIEGRIWEYSQDVGKYELVKVRKESLLFYTV